MNWTMPYPWRSRSDSVRRISISSEPGNESFFCDLRPIPRILSLRRRGYASQVRDVKPARPPPARHPGLLTREGCCAGDRELRETTPPNERPKTGWLRYRGGIDRLRSRAINALYGQVCQTLAQAIRRWVSASGRRSAIEGRLPTHFLLSSIE